MKAVRLARVARFSVMTRRRPAYWHSTVDNHHMKVAAIQLEPVIGDVEANLASCERLADEAGAAGAEWILLPEFFTAGKRVQPSDG
jgi:Carbon-nitrogen hydrolase